MLKDSAPPAGHDDSSASSAFSLGLPRHRGISSRCGSDRNLCSASAAVSPHPYGSLGLCKNLHQSAHSLRSARRKAAGTCLGQRRSRSSLEGEVPCSRTRFPRLATTTARHPQRSHSVSPATTASRRGVAAIGTSVRPQRPCPRTLMAPSVSAKFTPKCSLTPAQSPSLTSASTRSARRKAAGTCVGQRRSRSSLEGEVPCSRTRLPRLATTTARHPQRSHSVSPNTAASRRGVAAIGTSVRPQRPCPRTLMAPSVSAKFTSKCSLTPAQSPSLTSASTRSTRREAAGTCVGQRRSRLSLEGEVPCSRTRLPRLATPTARHLQRPLSVYPIRPRLCLWS